MRLPLDSWISITTQHGDPVPGSQFGKHIGTDFAAVNAPAKACVASTVLNTGTSSTVGNFVELHGDDNMYYRYLHLTSFKVAKGQRVNEGDVIATTGNTGSVSTGPHLHLDIRHPSLWNESFNNYVDPEVYLKGKPDMPRVPIPPEVVSQHYANFTTNLVKVNANDPAAQNRFEDTVDDEFWYGLCFQLKDLLRTQLAEVERLKAELANSQGEFVETKVYIKKG